MLELENWIYFLFFLFRELWELCEDTWKGEQILEYSRGLDSIGLALIPTRAMVDLNPASFHALPICILFRGPAIFDAENLEHWK